MRTLAVILATVLVLLQYKLWLSEDGLREVWRLTDEVATTTQENADKAARNAALEAEVVDLKQGLAAVEERARTELGMIGEAETYYLITQMPGPTSTAAK
jgi:cell division protein FtsB